MNPVDKLLGKTPGVRLSISAILVCALPVIGSSGLVNGEAPYGVWAAGGRPNAAGIAQGRLESRDNALARPVEGTSAAPAAGVIASVPKAAGGGQLPLNLKGLFPPAGAKDVCPDTPLRLTFTIPPVLGASGKIQVFDAVDRHPVDSIDISARATTKVIGGLDNFRYYPVIISGYQAVIYLKNGALAYNKTYFVTIDTGVFRDGTASYSGIDQPAAWRFTTKAAPRLPVPPA